MSPTDNYVRRVLEALSADSERVALLRDDERFTAGEFTRTVVAAAELLRRQTAEEEIPVVAVLTVANTPATIILRYAANLIGATVVHLHSTNAVDPTDQLATRERHEILKKTGATFLAVDEENLGLARELCGRLPEPPRLAALGSLGPDVLDLTTGDADAFDLTVVETDPERPAVVLFTSGTSGSPKGVTLPFRVRTLYLRAGLDAPGPITYLSTLPVSHSNGSGADLALASGGTVVLHEGFDASAVLDAVERHRVSALTLTPPQLYMLVDHPAIKDTDLSSIQIISYGGCPAAPARLAEAVEVFGPVLLQFYGTTETSGISVLAPPDHFDPELRSTAGRLTAEVRVRDVDDERDLPAGEIGEICVRSPFNMLGYWREPELTAETVRDGWVYTGDLGALDERGYVRLHGRVGEVMKTNGIKVHPTAVENALLTHPDVAQAAVYGVADGDRVEHIHAAVVLRTGGVADFTSLLDHVSGELSPKHVPAAITFHDDLPLTGAGKPDKQRLAAQRAGA
ncbi:class I adenylate-forming enzyme family protein [Streptomyces sp. GMR22]|uniref:class I adenylate-forming enzyme family protein n=1 Tax=Streptomyces sp. GMR22 TaxID=2759524 RepID=UPI0015FE0507|nr:fatty acid--CoA ligase family protein [Streptomyces sp. GMR22]MBA6433404.1 long-chain fatty acid--CoA ligase [Streptomyces sp. GMR22]